MSEECQPSEEQPQDTADATRYHNSDYEFARRLRHFLSISGITNKEFAELVSTDEGTVSRWVNGKQRPCKRRTKSIEELLGLESGILDSDTRLHTTRSEATGLRKCDPGVPTDANGERTREANSETPGGVMQEFTRWLEPHIESGGVLDAFDALEWMQRMWRASSVSNVKQDNAAQAPRNDSDIPLDIDVEPGTGIAITTSKGRLVVVNHALAKMLGSTPEDIIGRYVWELNAPEYLQAGKDRIAKQLTEPWDLELMTESNERIPVTISNVGCHLRGNPVRVALVKSRRDS